MTNSLQQRAELQRRIWQIANDVRGSVDGPNYLTKKQNVFQRISAFVEKFKGVGGRL
ncbi:MAG: hypothetical protein Q4G44_03045 [Alcaligenaceae bacterium]|nr:hypothetical protein [Alcaligenaceae bacterium]